MPTLKLRGASAATARAIPMPVASTDPPMPGSPQHGEAEQARAAAQRRMPQAPQTTADAVIARQLLSEVLSQQSALASRLDRLTDALGNLSTQVAELMRRVPAHDAESSTTTE